MVASNWLIYLCMSVCMCWSFESGTIILRRLWRGHIVCVCACDEFV